MIRRSSAWVPLLLLLAPGLPATPPGYVEPDFPFTKDSEVQPGVPEGRMERFVWATSSVYSGTIRVVKVYKPAGYDGKTALPFMVFQDGHAYADRNGQFRVPVVLDNLIARGDLPPMAAVFIDPGVFAEALPEETSWSVLKEFKSNRSVEYDTLSADYAVFLEKEILPEVAKRVVLSNDPKQRAIAGISSGGICAFTAAWERPDLFGKVMSHVGSFTNIRGGHVYPALIRKTPPKPIRVFLQDGAMDLDNEHGNWPLANRQMDAALTFAGYDHRFVFDEKGAHSGKFGGSILPDSLRWLWRPEEKTQ
jgi:enterochelin esterase family protein